MVQVMELDKETVEDMAEENKNLEKEFYPRKLCGGKTIFRKYVIIICLSVVILKNYV